MSSVGEDAGVHGLRIAHDRLEVHVREDVTVDIDAGRHLRQLKAIGDKAEDTALRDVQHALATPQGVVAGESAMLDLAYELANVALAGDDEAPVRYLHGERPRRECAYEHHCLGALADVDEPARSSEARPEARHVEIAVPVDLGEAEECTIEPATIVEIELIGLVDDGLRVHCGAEVEAGGRNAADHAGLGSQRDEIGRHPPPPQQQRCLPACRCRD